MNTLRALNCVLKGESWELWFLCGGLLVQWTNTQEGKYENIQALTNACMCLHWKKPEFLSSHVNVNYKLISACENLICGIHLVVHYAVI